MVAPQDPAAVAAASGCIVVPLLMVMVGAGVGLSLIGGVVAAILLALVVHSVTKDDHAKRMTVYAKQWYCHACGNKFHR
jgi:hypothetical protein